MRSEDQGLTAAFLAQTSLSRLPVKPYEPASPAAD
jgi:hypothetical protein